MKRKPRGLKMLQGTDRPDRDYGEVELPAPNSTEPPDWLTSPEAVDEWRRIVAVLLPGHVLSQGDMTPLGHLCNMHAAVVAQWGTGAPPAPPVLGQLRLMYGEFGLTPASRTKAATVPEDAKGNAFAKLRAV